MRRRALRFAVVGELVAIASLAHCPFLPPHAQTICFAISGVAVFFAALCTFDALFMLRNETAQHVFVSIPVDSSIMDVALFA
jgi:hypothetical protein